jgi:predicted HD phosphohydrolase
VTKDRGSLPARRTSCREALWMVQDGRTARRCAMLTSAESTSHQSDSQQPDLPERASFTSMDVSTREEWLRIGAETAKNQPRVAENVLSMLRSLEAIEDGFVTNQLVHSLQTATLAEKAGASEEVIVASLCHDIGKAVSVPNHPAIAAAILKPYVSDDVHFMISAHQDFQGRHYYHHFGGDRDARNKYADNPAYSLAAQFADEWDQKAFDPNGETYPLEHFEPMVRNVFARPRTAIGS